MPLRPLAIINKTSGHKMQVNKEWTWMDCNLTLKRASKKNQNQVFQILESEYSVQLQEDDSEAELNIEIAMQKRINCEESNGFTWHKSWNIPSIEVKISRRDLNAIKTQLGIARVYCEITSGYPIRKMIEFYIQQVTLEGETRKQIGSNGIARFTNLKFSETSFSHERNKFSLIMIIFTKNEERSRSVLKSFISMPIYVDSRKEARKKMPVNNFLVDLIPIDAFEESLEIRHQDKKQKKEKVAAKSSRSKGLEEQNGEEEKRRGKYVIEYTLGGFARYYSSANIRNKIKHPFYFTYHFSSLLTLYYNRQMAPSPIAVLRLLEKPLKHDSKKFIIIALTPAKGEQGEQSMEDLKKKIAVLFQNWKYFFLEVAIKTSLYFNFILQEKIPAHQQTEEDPDHQKWAAASPEQLLEAYQTYYEETQNRENEDNKNSGDSDSPLPAENSIENSRRYEHYELHQSICIQSSFKHPAPGKKVKIEE